MLTPCTDCVISATSPLQLVMESITERSMVSPMEKSLIVSTPNDVPKMNVSLPVPPVIVSLPAPPVIVSLPAAPSILSLPAPEEIALASSLPVTVSLPAPSVTFSIIVPCARARLPR